MADELFDPMTAKARICERECDTCIFKPDSTFRTGPGKLQDGRFKQFVKDAVAENSYIVCHESSHARRPSICYGFYSRFTTNTLRILTRLGLTKIDPETFGWHETPGQ